MLKYQEIYKLIEDRIKHINFDLKPVELYAPIKYVLSMGGKRLRPCLAILSNNMFCDKLDSIINPALGIEIFHNFTLLHDDIMDKALLRRNNSTVHIKWNENIAILSGDAMMIMSYDLIRRTDKFLAARIMDIFNKSALEECEGQQYDMNFENKLDVTIDQYLEMIKLKTASLIAASLAMGAVTGHAEEKDIELIYKFGINLGIAFQLQDDYLDVYAEDFEKFGKRLGGDILANKKTFLLISALQSENRQYVDELINWLMKGDFEPAEKIKAITAIYEKLSINSRTKELINDYFKRGIEYLEQVNVAEARKAILYDAVSETMKRER